MKVEIIKCDICGAEGAKTKYIMLDGQRKEADLCPKHAMEMLQKAIAEMADKRW